MNDSSDPLRLEIAAAAARLVADGGLDYAEAKKKAARQVLGDGPVPKRALPDNEAIDAALREHLELFDPDHGPRVSRRRQAAAALMLRLADFQPYLTGAVWKGIVAEHAPIHLQLFHDNAKEIEIRLLNEGVDFDVATTSHFRGGADVEAITFYLGEAPVLLTLYTHDELRGALKAGASGPERGDRRALLARLAEAA
ncbi:MAG: hypothetical protein J0H00_08995 [Burkholderiales bacterium]|nr:hypothetical protein [Burkholderiales bacterium]OJX06787.1 MAG: hypothetical protein BGO72_00375 [Burkholderiales bacterium 70-64]